MMNKESLVLRSRIRLARNVKTMFFPHRLSAEAARKLMKILKKAKKIFR